MNWFKRKTDDQPFEAKLIVDTTDDQLEVFSKTWRFILNKLDQKISAEREKNDAKRHDAIETAFMRGRISAFKEILDLQNDTGRKRPGIISRRKAGEEDNG